MNNRNLTSEQIIAIASEIRNNLKILDEAIGAFAVDFYGDRIKFQVYQNGLELVDGELVVNDLDGHCNSKTVNGIKFFALNDMGVLAG